jgi:aldehyde dehydrogenase (NAD+)
MEATATQTATKSIPISPNTKLEEVIRIFNLQQRNRQKAKNASASERKARIKKLINTIFEFRSRIEEALYKDLRKAQVESDFTEIYTTLSEARFAIAHINEWMAEVEVETPLAMLGSSSKIIYEPKGTCLILSPWNYPFQLPMVTLVSALAAGNTAIIKPSEYTPHTSAILKEVVGKAFDEADVAVIEGDHTVSTELLKLKWDHIHFTGSPAVGKVVMRAAAEYLTPVTLELGGKSPAIIDETANISAAAKKLTWGKWLNVGQTCIAPDYVLIQESKKDEFVAKMKEALTKSFGADPHASPDMARIVNSKNVLRVKGLLDDAVRNGAKIEVGGETIEEENYIAPTVLTNVSLDSRIMHEEIFGPVLPVVTYKDLGEAMAIVNSKEKPLSLYVFSSKSKNQNYVLNNSSAGGTCINDNLVHITNPYLPFGGVNNSGIGKSTGHFGFKEFSNERAVLKALHSGSVSTPLWFPYGKMAQTVTNFLMKYL